jgi:hypothetical protein
MKREKLFRIFAKREKGQKKKKKKKKKRKEKKSQRHIIWLNDIPIFANPKHL